MTFRKITLSAMVAIAIAAFTGFTATGARAQASATDNANINAVIANPITLANTGALDFGEISPSAGSTTLVVATDSSTSGDAVTVGGTPAAASFDVTGLALRSYTITLPGSTTIDDVGLGVAMTVNAFTHSAGVSPVMGAVGTDTFNVGATLTVGADQLAGSYTGSFNVTVNY